jgi:ABC-2 type transport system permease protein
MWERIFEIVRKELRQSLRNPRVRMTMIAPPILQTIIFGYAVNLDVEHVRLAVMDLDRSETSRDLIRKFTGSPYFTLLGEAQNDRAAQDLIDRGDVDAVVRIPVHFGEAIGRWHQSEVQVLLDGSNSNTASIIAQYAAGAIAAFNQETLQGQQNQRLVGRTTHGAVLLAMPTIRLDTHVWFNPELKSRYYFVPGVLVNIIMIVTLILTALSIVREKEIGTMEQIMVTPIRPIELMLGKTIPFALVGFADSVLVTALALLLFHVPFRGNALFLAFTAALFLLSTLGAGLFLSTISRTQQQAMMLAFFFIQPAFMLSGFTFPIRNMPQPVQWITLLNPLRYFMEIVRGVFLKGIGIDVLWPQVLILGVMGVVILVSSALRFHKRLD